MYRFILFLLTIVLGIWFYLNSKKPLTSYNFYHWKQSYINVQNLEPKYIKVLDIAYDNKLIVHSTNFIKKPKNKIVPVIYIDNPVFKKIEGKSFAKKVHLLLKKLESSFSYAEIQIDCDWSDSTKAAYFSFLKEFKKLSAKQLSTTIRLHQIKYHKRTGVPPVDRGILMYYNMSDFKDLETKNYILDLDLAKKYHYNFDTYPLKLDLALPLYAQANIIRFEEIVGIIEGIRKEDLNEHFQALKDNHYKVMKTHYFNKRLLYKDDILRIDEVEKKDLEEAIENLKTVMKQPEELIFYRWGNRNSYPKDFLESIANW